jgi:hypothetical protein
MGSSLGFCGGSLSYFRNFWLFSFRGFGSLGGVGSFAFFCREAVWVSLRVSLSSFRNFWFFPRLLVLSFRGFGYFVEKSRFGGVGSFRCLNLPRLFVALRFEILLAPFFAVISPHLKVKTSKKPTHILYEVVFLPKNRMGSQYFLNPIIILI